MIHGSAFELHESSPSVLGVCEGYDTVEVVFRRLIRFHNAYVFAFTFAFLVVLAFLRVAVVTGGVVVRSSTWPPADFRPMSHVLMSVELVLVVLVVRFPFWMWCLPLPCTLPFTTESTCIWSSSALVPFPADTVGVAPKFREE